MPRIRVEPTTLTYLLSAVVLFYFSKISGAASRLCSYAHSNLVPVSAQRYFNQSVTDVRNSRSPRNYQSLDKRPISLVIMSY